MSNENKLNTNEWVNLYANQLFAFAFTRTRSQALSEDLVQETFLSAFKAKDRFKGNSSEKTWLYSILKNKIIDHYRKSSTKNELNTLDDEDKNTDALFSDNGHWRNKEGFVTSKDEASKLAESNEFYEILDKCMGHLPERTRLAFQYKHIDGLETAEICKELNVSSSNYWVMLHRARLSLKDCLTKNKMR